MFRKLPVLHPLFALCLLLAPYANPQTASDRFDIHGKVINAATGEPIGGALVLLANLSQFTQSDGSFTFSNLPSRQFAAFAKKPGFFSDQELRHWNFTNTPVPDGDLIVKLTPEGIIFGQVKSDTGEPMDGVRVRAESWQIADGRRQLTSRLDTTTDDEGSFRIAELIPGSYYLVFAVSGRGSRSFNNFRRKTHEENGYGFQFYPGAADISTARPLEIRGGTQLHVVYTFTRQRLFELKGLVRGASQESPAQISFVSSSGDFIESIRLDAKTGQFQIAGVPAGTYLLSASAFRRGSGTQLSDSPLTAMLPIHVNSNLDGLILNLAVEPSAMVHLRDEVQTDTSPDNFHQVVVRMFHKEFSQYSPGVVVPASPDAPRAPVPIQGFAPGTYSVDATPTGTGYIAALRCGSIDLLRDDLTIAPGSAPPPIEVTLRSDGAQLNVALLDGAGPATFVIFSAEYPRRTILMRNYAGSTSVPNLAPGIYQVFALSSGADLEFRNPSAVEPYLKHASSVTLQPGDNTSVRVEMQRSADSQP